MEEMMFNSEVVSQLVYFKESEDKPLLTLTDGYKNIAAVKTNIVRMETGD